MTAVDRTLLILAWRSAATEREKAVIETRLAESLTREERAGKNSSEFLAKMLGASSMRIEKRICLHRVGSSAILLWEEVDERGMTISTAVRLLREAKAVRAKEGGELSLRIEQAIESYHASGSEAEVGSSDDGKVVRRRSPRGRETEDEAVQTPDTGRSLWLEVRRLFAAFLDKELGTVAPLEAVRVRRELEADLSMFIRDWGHRISNVKLRAEPTVLRAAVGRRKLVDAMRTLAMDPPPVGQPVDLTKARKQQRRIARGFHPDVVGDNPAMREQFECVMEAYRTCEEYNASLEGDEDHGRDDEERGEEVEHG